MQIIKRFLTLLFLITGACNSYGAQQKLPHAGQKHKLDGIYSDFPKMQKIESASSSSNSNATPMDTSGSEHISKEQVQLMCAISGQNLDLIKEFIGRNPKLVDVQDLV